MSDSTITDKAVTAPRRPYADPDLHTDYVGEDGEVEILSAGWDLSFGCRLSFGPEEDGTWRASVSMSDEPARVGHCVRTVTPEQVASHAAHLVSVLRSTGHGDLLSAAVPHLADQPATTGEQAARVDELGRWLDAADVAGYASVTDLLNAMRVRRDDLAARQSADRDTETAALRAALDAVRAEHEHTYLDEHYRKTDEGKAKYARCETCGNLDDGLLHCPTMAAASLRGGE